MVKDPIKQFGLWFEEARNRPGIQLPEAMCLSTVDPDGIPDARMLLLKGYDERGFVFYTNLESPKAKSIEKNPNAAITFYWEAFRRQVRIQGKTTPVSEKEADAYFASRARLSRIAAWVSRQSRPLADREDLEREFAEAEKKFAGKDIPRPPFWGGYRLVPSRIEFWEERPNRLHDRHLFIRKKDGWDVTRLYP